MAQQCIVPFAVNISNLGAYFVQLNLPIGYYNIASAVVVRTQDV